jgi:tetratricopeptide (TPR) repeat protein
MSMEEIEKLRARVEKDPNSRLFLPLAEEYRKSGMLDEAISVILRGLERQPGYTSARVALGRLYLEKNMMGEAKNEFEAVARAIPDNLFAHKKLADIYRDSGETEKAITEYETVISLNPLDDDARACLSEIMRSVPKETGFSAIGEFGLNRAAEMKESSLTLEQEISGTAGGEIPVEIPAEILEEEAVAVPEEELAGGFEEIGNSYSGIGEEEIEGPEAAVEFPGEEVFEVTEESPFENIFAAAHSGSEGASAVRETLGGVQEDSGVKDISEADFFVSAGNYYRALETYKDILSRDPDNRHILQRIAELKALMKLIGKDGEALVSRLEAFLDAVKRGFPQRP